MNISALSLSKAYIQDKDWFVIPTQEGICIKTGHAINQGPVVLDKCENVS